MLTSHLMPLKVRKYESHDHIILLISVSRLVYLYINIALFKGAKQGHHREMYYHSSVSGNTDYYKISSEAIGDIQNSRPKRTLARYRMNRQLLKYVLSNPKCKPMHLSTSSALNSKILSRLVTSSYDIITLASNDELRYATEKPQIHTDSQIINRMEETKSKINGKSGKYRNVILRTQRNNNDYDDAKNEYFLRFRRGGEKIIIICAKSY